LSRGLRSALAIESVNCSSERGACRPRRGRCHALLSGPCAGLQERGHACWSW